MKSNTITWFFCILFFAIGVLNAFIIHIVPGALYILLSLLYLPKANLLLKVKFGFSLPMAAKIGLGLVVLWSTLAVGDLVERFGL